MRLKGRKSTGEEMGDKRNKRNWALINLGSKRQGTLYRDLIYDEATLTVPQWAYRSAKYSPIESLSCKTVTAAIGDRCEVLGESFLGSSHEIPDEYKGYAEGKENVAW